MTFEIDDLSFELINEYQLTSIQKNEIAALLKLGFPEVDYQGRIYYKQLPHYRLLIKYNQEIIGVISLDYRAMRLNDKIINIIGVIDFVVHPNFQSRGIGKKSLVYLINYFKQFNSNIDFIYLVTDIPEFYKKLGFKSTSLQIKWMAIHQQSTHSILNQKVADCFLMYLALNDTKWEDGVLDMLGYWY